MKKEIKKTLYCISESVKRMTWVKQIIVINLIFIYIRVFSGCDAYKDTVLSSKLW